MKRIGMLFAWRQRQKLGVEGQVTSTVDATLRGTEVRGQRGAMWLTGHQDEEIEQQNPDYDAVRNHNEGWVMPHTHTYTHIDTHNQVFTEQIWAESLSFSSLCFHILITLSVWIHLIITCEQTSIKIYTTIICCWKFMSFYSLCRWNDQRWVFVGD